LLRPALRGAIIAALLLSLLFVLAACSESSEAPAGIAEQAAPQPAAPIDVVVHTLRARDWQSVINTFGVIEALEEVSVAAELSGTVSAVHVHEGDRVTAGQLLLELDPEKRRLAAREAEQAMQRARTALQDARLKLSRRSDLAERESVSREVLDSAQLAVDSAAAAYQQALATHRLAERELADTRIHSPTDGLVDVRTVEAGESVQAGASLIILQAVHGLRVHTWVSEADILQMRPGNKAAVSVAGLAGRTFPARVQWVGVNADPQTGNFPVKLILDNTAATLRPGMTASIELTSVSVPDVLLLPEEALVDRQRRRVVFVVADGVAQKREPLLAAGFSNRLQVLEGLRAGDSVVVEGQSRLLDGMPVRIQAER
tara:strand:+ start:3996 stop:5114 length:1119 start_codon:yes stop_codon:yes gene_type:complete